MTDNEGELLGTIRRLIITTNKELHNLNKKLEIIMDYEGYPNENQEIL